VHLSSKGNVKPFRNDLLIDKTAEDLFPTWPQNIEQWNKTGSERTYYYSGNAIWYTRIVHEVGREMVEMIKVMNCTGRPQFAVSSVQLPLNGTVGPVPFSSFGL